MSQASGPPTILVVEDNPLTRKLLRTSLEVGGYAVVDAADAATALASFACERPDLVLQDLRLPDMDGLDLLVRLRALPRGKDVPIIALSGWQSKLEESETLAVGFDKRLTKPIEPSRLLSMVEEYLPPGEPEGRCVLAGALAATPEREPPPAGAEVGPDQYVRRVVIQLERQVAANADLARRASLQAAALSILSAISDAIAKADDVGSAMDAVLSQCLDAAGISRGVLYELDADRRLVLRGQTGYPEGARHLLESFLGHAGSVPALLSCGDPLALPRDALPDGDAAAFVERAGARSVLLVPAFSRGEPMGVLLLASEVVDLTQDHWLPFAHTMGAQIGQALALARAFSSERRTATEALQEALRANEGLRRAKQAAEAANRELETFSYSVAHDLRAPLRHIDGFSQMLLAGHGESLDARGKEYLRNLRESAQKMALLIDDLLALSRVTRTELRRRRVDLTDLAQATARRLQASQPERQVEFLIADGVVGEGDRGLLGIVLDNLIGNAWKFTSKRPKATIEFAAREDGGRSVYFVRDDGVGFDVAMAPRLFGVFQRLHPDEEFEGTGIGLATVQRIVRRHGGRVWAEGEVGRGATFSFTLEDEERLA